MFEELRKGRSGALSSQAVQKSSEVFRSVFCFLNLKNPFQNEDEALRALRSELCQSQLQIFQRCCRAAAELEARMEGRCGLQEALNSSSPTYNL